MIKILNKNKRRYKTEKNLTQWSKDCGRCLTCDLALTGLARNVWGLSMSSTGTLRLTSPVKRGLLTFTLVEAWRIKRESIRIRMVGG